MTSLLFTNEENVNSYDRESLIFKDLNLDNIIDEIVRYAKLFNIKDYFYKTLKTKDDVLYRHEVFKDLENKELFDLLNLFSYTLQRKLKDIDDSNKVKYDVYKKIKLKQKIEEYLSILTNFLEKINKIEFKSRAINNMVSYIKDYLNSEEVKFIINDMKLINEEMKNVKYRLYFFEGTIKIAKIDEEESLNNKINSTLDKYECDDIVDFSRNYGSIPVHFLGQIYNELSKYYPREFKHLDLFSKHFNGFLDKTIISFSNDIQFYIAFIEMRKRIETMGLEFCYPEITDSIAKCVGGYDLALAQAFFVKRKKIVINDFLYDNNESIIVVSGPNQGGKTTFSRYVGQVFFMASLGLPVVGSEASLPLVSRIFTMYEVEEESSNLNGKLKSELIRIKDIMNQMTDNALLIMNEVFASTSLDDGIILGQKVIDMVQEHNSKALFVTFIEELSKYKGAVSMGSTVDKENPSIRTFEILRKLDNSNTYARSIAKKNNVSYDDIIRRIN